MQKVPDSAKLSLPARVLVLSPLTPPRSRMGTQGLIKAQSINQSACPPHPHPHMRMLPWRCHDDGPGADVESEARHNQPNRGELCRGARTRERAHLYVQSGGNLMT